MIILYVVFFYIKKLTLADENFIFIIYIGESGEY